MAIYVYDGKGNKKAWAGAEDDASLAKLGLSKSAPTSTPKLAKQPSYTIGTGSNPNQDKLYQEIIKGNSHMITDASGRKKTITQNAIDRMGIESFIDANGNFIETKDRSSSGSSNSGSLSGGPYDQEGNSLIAKLRASIAKAKAGYADIKNKAPQTYQPLRNQNEVSKESKLASMREALANQGNAGGTGRQELLGINALAENKKNEIDLQQQSVINDANSAIASLDEQAAFKESEITADMAAQKLQALLAENVRVDELNREQERYSQEYSDKIAQQEKDNQYKDKVYNDNLAEQQLEREINSIGAYSNDFMAEIKRREALPANDPGRRLIPFLYAERNQKIAKQLAEQDNSASQAQK
jgi:hypothetical protein